MIALLEFIEEHRSAIAYDLIEKGLRLRDFPSPRLTYGDLAVLVRHSPPGSALARELPESRHTFELELARRMEFHLGWLVWSKTRDGERGRRMPEPIIFPWEDDPRKGEAIAGDVLTTDEVDDLLGWSTT